MVITIKCEVSNLVGNNDGWIVCKVCGKRKSRDEYPYLDQARGLRDDICLRCYSPLGKRIISPVICGACGRDIIGPNADGLYLCGACGDEPACDNGGACQFWDECERRVSSDVGGWLVCEQVDENDLRRADVRKLQDDVRLRAIKGG